jgi:hypothetical protein
MYGFDLIVHISFIFLKGKNETWHLAKTFENNQSGVTKVCAKVPSFFI